MSRPASSLDENMILRVFQYCNLRTAAIAAAVCPHWSAPFSLCAVRRTAPAEPDVSVKSRYQCYRMHIDTLENLTTKDLLASSKVGYLQHFDVVRNLAQLAPLLQRLTSLELGLESASAAGLVVLQQLQSLRRLKLSPSTPGRQLRLEFVALRLLPSSLTELQLHFVPALGDDPLANVFPTVCFPNLRRLGLRFGAVPKRVREAEPFQATNTSCPLLTWLEVVGPDPFMIEDSDTDTVPDDIRRENMSVQFLTRFPAIQTL